MEYYNSYQSISKLKYILYRINCFNDGFKKKLKYLLKLIRNRNYYPKLLYLIHWGTRLIE